MDDFILKGASQGGGFFMDDPRIFETIMEDDPQKIYQELRAVQAPVRAKIISFLEDIDQKYGAHIGDDEIAKVDEVLFTSEDEEKYLNAQAFEIIGAFLNKKCHGIAKADKETFENLTQESKRIVSSFLNQTKSVNNEPPLLHALIWCKFKVADVLRKEGAALTDEMIKKNIIWSMDKNRSIKWLIDAGSRVTDEDIQKAREYERYEIVEILKTAYDRQTQSVQNPSVSVVNADVKLKVQTASLAPNVALEKAKSRKGR